MTELKLKPERFTVDVEPEFLHELMERTIQKSGSTMGLAEYIIKKHKLKICIHARRLADNIKKWQRKKQSIPLVYYLTIGNHAGVKDTELYKNINGIRLYKCRKNIHINYPLTLNKYWGFVSECIRVEGTITKKAVILENTNTEITAKFEQCVRKLGIPKGNIHNHLNVRIQIPESTPRNSIRIINLETNKEIENFHMRILKLKRGLKKEIAFYNKNFSYGKPLLFKVCCANSHFFVKVIVPKNGKIICTSNLKDERYKKTCVSLFMQIDNKTLVWILENIFDIPVGKKSSIITIPDIIKSAEREILADVVSVVLACESTISIGSRWVNIVSLSADYLRDFQEILARLTITSNVNKNSVRICGSRNFAKLKECDFIINEKIHTFKKLLINKVVQSPKGQSKTLYLKSLNELGIATWPQIRTQSNRIGNSSRIYLKELLERKLVKRVGHSWPREYVMTVEGKKHLERNKMYWE
ncbi:MAG: hypothetical protein ISS93_01525 [Candidatus Aenigmarchaeota archaeon]|nr:hypothetical protein [Candidatus Aenigmarchaeota archaeon]